MILEKAIMVATAAHLGQVRKGTDIPYITHPMKVMAYLLEMNANTEVVCAGVLHDTVEDGGLTVAGLRKKFGDYIANLVGEHSEDKSLSWEERKKIDLQALAAGPRELKMMVLADKLANSSDTLADYKRIKDEVWKRFNRGKKQQKWYYEESVKALATLKDDPDAGAHYRKFQEVVKELFGGWEMDRLKVCDEDIRNEKFLVFPS